MGIESRWIEHNKYLSIGNNTDDVNPEEYKTLEACTKYVYLGTQIEAGGRTEESKRKYNNVGRRVLKTRELVEND